MSKMNQSIQAIGMDRKHYSSGHVYHCFKCDKWYRWIGDNELCYKCQKDTGAKDKPLGIVPL